MKRDNQPAIGVAAANRRILQAYYKAYWDGFVNTKAGRFAARNRAWRVIMNASKIL